MTWNKTSRNLPLRDRVGYTDSEIIVSKKIYLLLVPNGSGWERVMAHATWSNKGEDDSLLYWHSIYNYLYRLDPKRPLYWMEIDMPDDAAEVLSDWQDDQYDKSLT